MGYSADGDPRLLKAMTHLSCLGNPNTQHVVDNNKKKVVKGFRSTIQPSLIYTQDTVHILTKLRNRFLKDSIVLPMGNFGVSKGFLQIVKDSHPKDQHFLVEKDFDNKDKMNFPSVIKMSHSRVINLLKPLPGSEATQEFLKLVNFIGQSFLSKSLHISERIYCIWYSVFFLRMWKSWIEAHEVYTVQDNFITSNTYKCIKLNAHALINMILYCEKLKDFILFEPRAMSSQACEGFYRLFRSMSSTFCTIVNCSVLEGLHRIRRIQLLSEILHFDFDSLDENIQFPRKSFLNASYETIDDKWDLSFLDNLRMDKTNVSIDSINAILKKAKTDAFNCLKKLGIAVKISEADHLKIKLNKNLDILDEEEYDEDYNIYAEENCGDNVRSNAANESGENLGEGDESIPLLEFNLKDYSEENTMNESAFTVVKSNDGSDIIVRKASICWVFNQGSRGN